ncbi:MAG: trigger factor [Oscillospiraceae bacterium]|nr:trigger factor [Oscillospiraceae bacterium]
MNVKSAEKQENSTVKLEIEVPAEEFDAAVDKVYKKNKSKYNVPGFRKGKCPRKIFESMYGPSVLYGDAIEMVYPDAYDDAIKDQDLCPVTYPEIDIVSVGKEGLVFSAVVTVKPEVKLGQYKGLSAPKPEVEVTEESIMHEMQPLIDQASRLVSVERPAQTGDTVIIDFQGTIDGEPIEGGSSENFNLELGSNTFIPGFEDGVVGMEIDETKEIPVTFPKEYSEDLANKDAVFTVTLHEIKEKEVPELDDDFAKDVSEFETLDELKKSLADNLEKNLKKESEDAFRDALIRQVCENAEVEIPKAMVDQAVEDRLNEMSRSLQQQGLTLDQYLGYYGLSRDQMADQLRGQCQQEILQNLVLDAVTEAENIEATDEEIEEVYKNGGLDAQNNPIEEEELRQMISEEDMRYNLVRTKTVDVIVDSATVADEPEEKESDNSPQQKKAGEAETEADADQGTEESGDEKKDSGKDSGTEKSTTKKSGSAKSSTAKKSDSGKTASAKKSDSSKTASAKKSDSSKTASAKKSDSGKSASAKKSGTEKETAKESGTAKKSTAAKKSGSSGSTAKKSGTKKSSDSKE